jgi:putative peptidoglycan lipid II flippase
VTTVVPDGARATSGGDGPEPRQTPPALGARRPRGTGAALLVAIGIFLSRVFGLVRSRVMARYLGTSDAADAFTSASRIPNFLQNLFGEGVLSASFIPVYSRLLAEGDEKEADRVAGAVFGLLAATVALLVAAGVLATPLFVDTIASGFTGDKRDLTVRLVRILFPGTGLLVLCAWCLGILNSHRKFFISYAAPVLWNVAIIAGLIVGPHGVANHARLVEQVAWWTVGGCVLQFVVQAPMAIRALGRFRPSLDTTSAHVREVVRNFVPVFIGRGAVQISGYVDLNFASQLGSGAQAALGYAQNIYLLPVSLFGMSISAAELPAMSGQLGTSEEIHAKLRTRLLTGLRRIAFFVIPSAMAFLALGDVIAAVLFQTGAFRRNQSVYIWGILAGSAVGLLASTLARLYSSTFYALKDTRTPLRFALVRIALTIALGWLFAFPLPKLLGLEPRWGAAGLTASAGIAGWVEFAMLRHRLNGRIGETGVPARLAAGLWLAAGLGAACAWGAKLYLGLSHPLVDGSLILGVYGLVYFLATFVADVPEAQSVVRQVLRKRPAPVSPVPPA